MGSGTSASWPHVSRIIGLLKRLYSNWSLAALKSALMIYIMSHKMLYFCVAWLFLYTHVNVM